jgi:hypothetical protein
MTPGEMKGTSLSFDAVMAEHKEDIDRHMNALANIFERAGAGDRIDTMILKPYVETDIIEVVWDRADVVINIPADDIQEDDPRADDE